MARVPRLLMRTRSRACLRPVPDGQIVIGMPAHRRSCRAVDVRASMTSDAIRQLPLGFGFIGIVGAGCGLNILSSVIWVDSRDR